MRAPAWTKSRKLKIVGSRAHGVFRGRKLDDLIAQRGFSAPKPLYILDKYIEHILFISPRFAGGVRRDENIGEIPQGGGTLERLLHGHVDAGSGNHLSCSALIKAGSSTQRPRAALIK